jgi:U4/U6 small nuclear ribonucleoprotein PRP3
MALNHPLQRYVVLGSTSLLILTRNHEQIAPNDLIAQKRAEIAAKMAAMKTNVTGVSVSIVAAPVPAVSASPTPATSGSSTPGVNDDLARRIAEIRKQVAVAHSKVAVRDNPYMVGLYAS